jgi:glyoxylase-like metal-dependent hydrolase (beta-lactamase superfamily II)
MICHCLLVESERGLVLVDTGMGREDLAAPRERLGTAFVAMLRPRVSRQHTAVAQLEELGYAASDVRHIVLTHLDLDHAGGLADFPTAKVHVLGAELERANARPTAHDRRRYRPAQWAHAPSWETYDPGDFGEDWYGFRAVRELRGLPPEILLVPLVGHTTGHVGVALDTGGGWLLHCGDAYFYRGEMQTPAHCTPGLRVFQRFIAADNALRVQNRDRLAELARSGDGDVHLFCAHDPVEFHALRDASP